MLLHLCDAVFSIGLLRCLLLHQMCCAASTLPDGTSFSTLINITAVAGHYQETLTLQQQMLDQVWM